MSEPVIVAGHKSDEGNLKAYVTGFILSVVLTLITYFSVTKHILNGNVLIGFIIVLAFVQYIGQLIFFLHLGREDKPRFKLLIMSMMIMIVAILVIGSLWIMNNLNYRMTPQEINNYMQQQDGGF